MGLYLNKGNDGFTSVRNGLYVDKSMLIEHVNKVLFTENRFMCVTRARRFGKSVAVKMLNAYYDKSCDSRHLFEGLRICDTPAFNSNLNRYPVIYLDMTDFITKYRNESSVVKYIQADISRELLSVYKNVSLEDGDDLMDLLVRIVESTGEHFIVLIDEWDALCREGYEVQMDEYVDLLRRLFKGSKSETVFAGAYLTGILPIKRYNTQSALNNFEEFSMLSPADLAPFFGFTEQEVFALCEGRNIDVTQMKMWYDGYKIGMQYSIYNPYAVMRALNRGRLENYWTGTNSFENLKRYLLMNFDGLKDAVISLLADIPVTFEPFRFNNDMHQMGSKDDVLALLCHLGYLTYDFVSGQARVPNYEVRQEFEAAVKESHWQTVAEALGQSDNLLHAVMVGDQDEVAAAIDEIHRENISVLRYNDENSLACVLALAFYTARGKYRIQREMPLGKGFADLVLLPLENLDIPAIVLELKYDKTADSAIAQIKRQQYAESLKMYSGELLLVGINYDKKTKKHSCRIEKLYRETSASAHHQPIINPSSTHHQPIINPSSNPNVNKLVSLMGEGLHSTTELMKMLNMKDRVSFQKNYLKPALDMGYVQMLYPDNPRQRGQKYYRSLQEK